MTHLVDTDFVTFPQEDLEWKIFTPFVSKNGSASSWRQRPTCKCNACAISVLYMYWPTEKKKCIAYIKHLLVLWCKIKKLENVQVVDKSVRAVHYFKRHSPTFFSMRTLNRLLLGIILYLCI